MATMRVVQISRPDGPFEMGPRFGQSRREILQILYQGRVLDETDAR